MSGTWKILAVCSLEISVTFYPHARRQIYNTRGLNIRCTGPNFFYKMYSCVQIHTDMYKHKYTNKYFKEPMYSAASKSSQNLLV